MNESDRKLVLGFLLGTGVGVGTMLLLNPKVRERIRALLMASVDDVAAGMETIGQGLDAWREKKTEKTGRRLQKYVNSIRASGL